MPHIGYKQAAGAVDCTLSGIGGAEMKYIALILVVLATGCVSNVPREGVYLYINGVQFTRCGSGWYSEELMTDKDVKLFMSVMGEERRPEKTYEHNHWSDADVMLGSSNLKMK